MPAVIVKKRISNQLYVIYVGQKVKQRIAGSRNKKFVARIAEQSKYKGVGFTGAGSQDQIVNANAFIVLGIVSANGLRVQT